MIRMHCVKKKYPFFLKKKYCIFSEAYETLCYDLDMMALSSLVDRDTTVQMLLYSINVLLEKINKLLTPLIFKCETQELMVTPYWQMKYFPNFKVMSFRHIHPLGKLCLFFLSDTC